MHSVIRARFRIVAVCLLGLIVTTAVRAQLPPPPNPTDLRAAYCIEVTKTMINMMQQALSEVSKPLPPNASAELAKKLSATIEIAQNGLAAENATLRKLQLYLLPRMQYINPLGVVAAQRSAKR
jgi:hypothetical protein